MERKEMKIEQEYSDQTFFINEEKNMRIIVKECNQSIGRKQMYLVRVVEIDPATGYGKSGETVGTRCNYDQAMRIARQYYFG